MNIKGGQMTQNKNETDKKRKPLKFIVAPILLVGFLLFPESAYNIIEPDTVKPFPIMEQTPEIIQEPMPAPTMEPTPEPVAALTATPILDEGQQDDAADDYTAQEEDEVAERKSIDPSLPMVALTFDDGPADTTEQILDILEEHNVVATFYVIGAQAARRSDTIIRAFDMGSEIANHTWSHEALDSIPADSIRSQLLNTCNKIESIIGIRPSSMRPPFGRVGPDLHDVTRELGLPIVTWTIDPSDYLNRQPEVIYSHVIDRVQDGDIILLHDIHERTVEATKLIVPSLIEMGFQLVTVSELMYHSDITPRPGSIYTRGRS